MQVHGSNFQSLLEVIIIATDKPEPAGLPARRAALQLLDRVLRRGETIEQSLGHVTKGMGNASDRGLTHNIAATVLRWLGALDALIDGAMERPLPPDAKARSVLRIALAQALILETAEHAAIATALPLVEGGPRRLVHGVFSAVMRQIKAGKMELPLFPPLPEETAERWRAHWGQDVVAAAEQAWAAPPPLDLCFKDQASADRLASVLSGTAFAPLHLRIAIPSSVMDLAGFEEGDWWVQDFAASLAARLLGAGQGRTMLDLCAAPGGKAMQFAAAGWQVTALDNDVARMGRLKENLARTRLAAETVIADAMTWEPATQFDAVLLDAPCSATGIYRRHPDVLHIIGPRQIAERAALQARLLERAAAFVKPGGMMVYSVCSLEPEEGEAQIAKFLTEHEGWQQSVVTAAELPADIAATEDGFVRTLPNMLHDAGALDGFFIARLTRAG